MGNETCDGCKDEFDILELFTSCDKKYQLCTDCTYEYEAKLDAVTDNE